MKKIVLSLLYLVLIGTALPFLLGFINSVHPLFDSFSNFRVHLLIILLALTFIIAFFHEKPYNYLFLIITILGGFFLYRINQPFLAKPSTLETNTSFKQMQFNLSFRNQRIDKFKEYILKNPIDIITLQEVTSEHRGVLEELKTDGYHLSIKKTYPFIEWKKGAYPYQVYGDFRGVGGGAILSKYPINEEKIVTIENQGFLWAEVMVKNQPIAVGVIHLFWPFPYSQQAQIAHLRPVLENMPKPILISGDFNAVSWSDAVNKIASYSDTKVVEGMRWSIELKSQLPLLPFMKLSIDQLLLSEQLMVKKIEIEKSLGSDHLPIISEIILKKK
jgi:endonuclease/exonuclease/phosphatase (EEP) superfamily protein YafD